METKFTLEYWIDDSWYVGRLREIPGIFSQGESLKELEENVIDAYKIMMDDIKNDIVPIANTNIKEIRVDY